MVYYYIYKYIDLGTQVMKEIREWQYNLCKSLKLNGRILLAKEGINGTVNGSKFMVLDYIYVL